MALGGLKGSLGVWKTLGWLLGCVLGPSWGRLGAAWGRFGVVLGRLGGVLEASWGVWRRLRLVLAPLGASWAVLGSS